MEDFEIPAVDSHLDDEATGYCRFCGHLIMPVEPPEAPDEPPF